MWGKWSGVTQRIKDLAVEITTPQYEDDYVEGENHATLMGKPERTPEPHPQGGPTRRLQDELNLAERPTTAIPARGSVGSGVTMTPPTRNAVKTGNSMATPSPFTAPVDPPVKVTQVVPQLQLVTPGSRGPPTSQQQHPGQQQQQQQQRGEQASTPHGSMTPEVHLEPPKRQTMASVTPLRETPQHLNAGPTSSSSSLSLPLQQEQHEQARPTPQSTTSTMGTSGSAMTQPPLPSSPSASPKQPTDAEVPVRNFPPTSVSSSLPNPRVAAAEHFAVTSPSADRDATPSTTMHSSQARSEGEPFAKSPSVDLHREFKPRTFPDTSTSPPFCQTSSASIRTTPPPTPTRHEDNSNHAQIIALRQYVAQLTMEKQQLEVQVLQYKEEAMATHEQNVAHYERCLETAQREAAVNREVRVKLERELTERNEACRALQSQVGTLFKQLEAVKTEVNAKEASNNANAIGGKVNAELEAQLCLSEEAREVLKVKLQEEQRTHRAASEEKDTLLVQSREQAERLSEIIARLEGDAEHRRTVQSTQEGTVTTLRAELDELRDKLQHEKDSRKVDAAHEAELAAQLTEKERRVVRLQEELTAAQRFNTERQSDESNVAALNARRRELEADVAHFRGLTEQLEHIVTDCLVRADVELPGGKVAGGKNKNNSNIQAPSSSNSGGGGGGGMSSFSDKVTLLASEFNRLLEVSRHGEKVGREWEHTYEQARAVNATLNQQVSEAWKTIGTLREELSMREQSLSKLKQQLQAEAQQHRDAQHTVAVVSNELQTLKEEKRAWQTRILESANGAANHEERLAEMVAELETLKTALQDRDEELAQAQLGVENMQQVLDALKMSKERDVAARTADMQVEIDELKAELVAEIKARDQHPAEIDALIAGHRKEMAAKSIEITSLHRKLAELRKALEETARQLNGEMMIDKRVISHLVVNYIHAFVGQRREADEMLKVLSGLLNWDEAMQEKAGLLPGPTNPKPGQQGRQGLIGGLVRTVWRNPQRRRSSDAKARDTGASIAELWVEFLMRESETAMTSHTDNASEATPALLPAIPASEEVPEGDGAPSNTTRV